MSTRCPYCHKKFTCGCQKTKLPSGVVVCKGCSKKNLGRKGLKNTNKPTNQNERMRNERARPVHN